MISPTRSLPALACALSLVFLTTGCEEERNPQKGHVKTKKPKIETRETLHKWTQEVRNLKPELAQGGQVTDGKVHSGDYLGAVSESYRVSVGNIAIMNVKHAIDLYEAEHGEKPKTYEEFMDLIIRKGKPDGIQLPMLPYYQEYGYDPDAKELVVIEYPAKKKEYQEQQDRELGRK